MPILLQYFIMGFLGMLLHVFAVKFPSLKSKHKVANEPLTFQRYISEDWPALIADLVAVLLLVFGIKEILNLYPALEKAILLLFAFVGYTGSSIMLAIFSVVNKRYLSMVDVKTDIADGKTK